MVSPAFFLKASDLHQKMQADLKLLLDKAPQAICHLLGNLLAELW